MHQNTQTVRFMRIIYDSSFGHQVNCFNSVFGHQVNCFNSIFGHQVGSYHNVFHLVLRNVPRLPAKADIEREASSCTNLQSPRLMTPSKQKLFSGQYQVQLASISYDCMSTNSSPYLFDLSVYARTCQLRSSAYSPVICRLSNSILRSKAGHKLRSYLKLS